MLVIADEAKPLALAGIMGGNESGVISGAVDLFLESAFFSPDVIAGKSFSLGFSSDSAYRFERGVDFGATRAAMERATGLILDICGGRAGPITELRGSWPTRDPIRLDLERVGRVLGVELDEGHVAELLHRLQFGFLKYRRGILRDASNLPIRSCHRRRPDRGVGAYVRIQPYSCDHAASETRHTSCARNPANTIKPATNSGGAGLPGSHQLCFRRNLLGNGVGGQQGAYRVEKPFIQSIEGDAQQPFGGAHL